MDVSEANWILEWAKEEMVKDMDNDELWRKFVSKTGTERSVEK